jgi:chromosome partitioning protein
MVFHTIINRNTKLGEAPSFGQTIMIHDINSTGAMNYLNLAREIIQNNKEPVISPVEQDISQ